MTSLGLTDDDLHYPNGEHRTTAPTTSGRAIALYEKRIRAHLEKHRGSTIVEVDGEPVPNEEVDRAVQRLKDQGKWIDMDRADEERQQIIDRLVDEHPEYTDRHEALAHLMNEHADTYYYPEVRQGEDLTPAPSDVPSWVGGQIDPEGRHRTPLRTRLSLNASALLAARPSFEVNVPGLGVAKYRMIAIDPDGDLIFDLESYTDERGIG